MIMHPAFLHNPGNFDKVLDLPELRISGHDSRFVLKRRGEGETAGKGYAVLDLKLGGLIDQTVRHGLRYLAFLYPKNTLPKQKKILAIFK